MSGQKLVNIQRGILTSSKWESALRDDAMGQAQRMIATVAATTGNICAAQTHAEHVIKTLFAAAGVEVDVVWNSSEHNKEHK